MTVPPTPPKLVEIDASEPLEKMFEVIARDGGIIVKNLLSPELLKECMDTIEPHFETRKCYDQKSSSGELGDDFFPAGSIRVYGLLAKWTSPLIKIMRLPVWQGIMDRFLR
jgi:hypothetical protein